MKWRSDKVDRDLFDGDDAIEGAALQSFLVSVATDGYPTLKDGKRYGTLERD